MIFRKITYFLIRQNIFKTYNNKGAYINNRANRKMLIKIWIKTIQDSFMMRTNYVNLSQINDISTI